MTGSTVTDTAHHFTYNPAGNIASKQLQTSGTAATMTTYSHNSLDQVTAIGGTAGPMPVIVRGDTNEPATVEVKSGATGSAWKDARMLAGNCLRSTPAMRHADSSSGIRRKGMALSVPRHCFESDLDLAAGANAIDVRATDGSSNVANYTYSLTLAAATAAAPAYDAEGNMTSDGVRSYEWNFASKLTKVTWGGSPMKSTEYRYNALGQRSERIEKSGTTETAHYYYLYQGIRLLCRYVMEVDANSDPSLVIDRQYLSQGEQRKISTDWSSYYYNRDHLGSVREVMNADGTLAARYDYTPYGIRRVQYESTAYTGGCDLGFTGHITQLSPVSGQSELVLTHFRGYDPELGRWLSADPIGEAGGLNLYGYVGNNPINGWDLLGLKNYACFANGPGNPASDVNSFKSRGAKGAGLNVFPFDSPSSLNSALQGAHDITRLDLHGHGIPGSFFTGDMFARINRPDLDLLAKLIADGKIDVKPKSGIRLFACNQDSNAQYLSKKLGELGRGDISVTGANGPVYANQSETRALVDGGKFNTYRNGEFTGGTPSIPYK